MATKKKKLKIAQIAPLWFPVPPVGYGGTELVVSRITEGLVKRGHSVTLFASGDSRTAAKLISPIKKNLFDLGVPWLHDSYNILNLVKGFELKNNFDIIHTHIDVHDPLIRSYNSDIPSVATLHNMFWAMPHNSKKNKLWFAYQGRELLYKQFSKLPYISISESYRKLCPIDINFIKTIYHGVDTERLKFNSFGGDSFVWLGRIDQSKGVHVAVRLAKKLGIKLLIAGAIVNPDSHRFFKEQVKPYLGRKIKYVGELKSEKQKSEFFGNAKAFLYPLQWDEPFGLTMIESQACGTPVIAFRRGSVPELVKNGITGFVINDITEMKKAMGEIDKIDRRECRRNVELNFTTNKMLDAHEELYAELIKNRQF